MEQTKEDKLFGIDEKLAIELRESFRFYMKNLIDRARYPIDLKIYPQKCINIENTDKCY
jgi:hypothetical protein